MNQLQVKRHNLMLQEKEEREKGNHEKANKLLENCAEIMAQMKTL